MVDIREKTCVYINVHAKSEYGNGRGGNGLID